MLLDQELRSRSSRPEVAVSMRAASATVRVIGPKWARSIRPLAGYWAINRHDGLSPNSPVKPHGIRIDPAPSVPCARGPSPAATAADAPPDEPPGVRLSCHGLCVVPVTRFVVSPFHPNSGVLVLPNTTAPEAYVRSMNGASSSGTQSA